MAKGFKYIYGQQGQILQEILNSLNFFSQQVGFNFLFIPTVAEEGVYQKVGDGSDLMTQKQIFYLEGRGSNKKRLILRPEFTGGIMHHEKDHEIQGSKRYVSYGPVFRRENPQRGRLRGFVQHNLEIFSENNFSAIFDLLWPSLELFRKFNISVIYEFNYLPGKEYLEELTEYFQKNRNKLSKLSQLRLEKGAVLRIFDSKQAEDQPIIDNAPEIVIPQDKLRFFDQVEKFIAQRGQRFKLNKRLVRGLDYYEGFVFEVIQLDNNSMSLGALGGGGCYSCKQGKKIVPAVGMALGINRIIPLVKLEKSHIIRVGILSSELFHLIPQNNFSFLKIQEKSFEKSLKYAQQQACEYIIFKKSEEYHVRSLTGRDAKDSNILILKNIII
jgi:histidyl-tRNA synthetase